ncbi:hypothetical protein D9615_005527 [Tricholomella constricta]|uniref:Integrase catalytic domain-containing protein n=1 Tax=Tricholomella constricta TaxID=117010 RepID=A0A8H5HDJ4_9AGAR|nr:hypothetical protein D9615_005527 [Tricholomella constricta]
MLEPGAFKPKPSAPTPSDVEPVAGKDWQLESTIMVRGLSVTCLLEKITIKLPILRQFLARFSFSPSLRTTELRKLSPSTVGLAVGKSIRKLYGSLGGRSPHDGQDETCGRHFSPGSHSIRFRDCDRPLTQSALTFHDHAYASSVVFVSYYHDTEDTSSHQYLMAIPLHNISVTYEELTRSVDLALRTQIGDAARLGEQKRLCLEFQAGVRLHAHLLPAHDLQTVQSSVGRMVAALDEATTTSSDFPDAPPVAYSSMVVDGTQGHPRIDIKPEDLARFSTGRATRQQIADIYGCSARTIRRRLVEFGLSSPGPPVYTDVQHTNGSIERIFSSGVSSDLLQISDAELDQVMLNIYEQFPSFRRRMIDGYLLRIGEHVPRQRILDSYLRVIGPTTSTFATRRIQRRVYSVPGPNSLWHHDGQHGLIHWKIVIHAFIDGFSRFSLGIHASNNNRAETVLCLFEDIAAVFGYPSRTRGDHGTENLLVASRMEEVRGEGRGSYIWGKSVHNIRIERLWVDVTRGFGRKWKDFFRILEAHDGLNAHLDAHIWLLHHLFLNSINHDAQVWAETWNHHTLSRRNDSHQSPHDMFLYGMVENGHRGVQIDESIDDEDFAGFGIDWDSMDDATRAHHDENNADDGDPSNPFLTNHPDHLSHVDVSCPRCPFSAEQLNFLDTQLATLPTFMAGDMPSRRLLWIDALGVATNILQWIHKEMNFPRQFSKSFHNLVMALHKELFTQEWAELLPRWAKKSCGVELPVSGAALLLIHVLWLQSCGKSEAALECLEMAQEEHWDIVPSKNNMLLPDIESEDEEKPPSPHSDAQGPPALTARNHAEWNKSIREDHAQLTVCTGWVEDLKSFFHLGTDSSQWTDSSLHVIDALRQMRAVSATVFKSHSWTIAVQSSGLADILGLICSLDTRLEMSAPYIARSFRFHSWKESFGEVLDAWTPAAVFEKTAEPGQNTNTLNTTSIPLFEL